MVAGGLAFYYAEKGGVIIIKRHTDLTAINLSWSMDFVSDQLFDGKKIQSVDCSG